MGHRIDHAVSFVGNRIRPGLVEIDLVQDSVAKIAASMKSMLDFDLVDFAVAVDILRENY